MSKSQKIIFKIEDLITEIKSKKNLIILPTTLHDVYWSSRLLEYDDVDVFVPDGMPLVWSLRKKYDDVERLYGPEIFVTFLREFRDQKHIFMASKEVLKKIQAKNKHLNAKYISLPYAREAHFLINDKDIDTIANFSPDLIWMGLSTPKQVKAASYLKKKIFKQTFSNILCVGAAFDFYVGDQKRTHPFFQKCGLEWLFRLFHNPKRLWKRYIIYSVLAISKLPQFIKNVDIETYV